MKGRFVGLFVILALVLFGLVPVTHAELQRVGPNIPVFGYPSWYQDKGGMVAEFCTPLNQAELDGGWCLLAPPLPIATAPEVFPTNFSDEHFYWAAGANIDFNSTGGLLSGRAVLVLAIEAAFASGGVLAGDQVTFGRVRVDIRDLPFDGDYTVYHPYGVWTFPGQLAGDRLFFTEDIGLGTPGGPFTGALATTVGPFLLASATAGGAELPPVAGPVLGKLYIADPGRLGPATGSPIANHATSAGPLNGNRFRVEGPGGFVIDTTDFTLMGRLFDGTLAGQVNVSRASYASSLLTGNKLDVFATATATTQTRIPGSPALPAVKPVLSFYSAACGVVPGTGALTLPAGVPPIQMANTGANYWAQTSPVIVPASVCVEDFTARNGAGQATPAFYQKAVTDQVFIDTATYFPANGGTLSVTARSSDEVNPTILTLVGFGDLAAGQIAVTPLAAPSATISVRSSNGDVNSMDVTTVAGAPGGGNVPIAVNDAIPVLRNTQKALIVLANDTLNGVPIVSGPGVVVSIVAAPRLGTAIVIPTTNRIRYTPNLGATGRDVLTYKVTVNGVASSIAEVTVTIN